VRQHAADVDLLPLVFDTRYQSKVVAADVEHREPLNEIC
jgi:hypothetical protein